MALYTGGGPDPLRARPVNLPPVPSPGTKPQSYCGAMPEAEPAPPMRKSFGVFNGRCTTSREMKEATQKANVRRAAAGALYEHDGVLDTARGHARRLGRNPDLVAERLRKNPKKSIAEALLPSRRQHPASSPAATAAGGSP